MLGYQKYTTLSTGVLYVSIVNLLYYIWFKHKNTLLPGLDKVSLYKINHYLSPVVDELESLWHGMALNSTAEFAEERTIRDALILISYDITAARKLMAYIGISIMSLLREKC